jgi:DNA primase
MKDVMTLYSLGISAIAPNSETQFVSEKVLEELKQRFEHIVLLYDNDLTGVRFTNKLRKQYPELIVTLIPRKTGAKDISDHYYMYGRNKTLELIKEGIKIFKNGKKVD